MDVLILSILHQKHILIQGIKVNHGWISLDPAVSTGAGWCFVPGSGTRISGQMTTGGHVHQLCMALREIRCHRHDKDLHDCGCKSKCQRVKLGNQTYSPWLLGGFARLGKCQVLGTKEWRKTPGLWWQGPATQSNFAKQLNLSQHSGIWGFSGAELTQSTSWIWEDCW